MKTRRGVLTFFLVSITLAISAFLAAACGSKPDAQTEPSPEWPPKDE